MLNKFFYININIQTAGKLMSIYCTVGYKWCNGTASMDGVKFETNDIGLEWSSLYTKNNSVRRPIILLSTSYIL